jgi:hypothetical protein
MTFETDADALRYLEHDGFRVRDGLIVIPDQWFWDRLPDSDQAACDVLIREWGCVLIDERNLWKEA